MVDTPLLAVSAAALLLGGACFILWRNLAGSRRAVDRLREQIAHLQAEQAVRPSLRVAFEFSATTREALLHVTNDGREAVVWAHLSVEGAVSQQVESGLRAVWRNPSTRSARSGPGESASSVVLRQGETRTLRLAQLDLSVFPYAQWEIFAAGPASAFAKAPADKTAGGPADKEARHYGSMRATHTSMIGGNPDTHAPPLFIEVALACSPESAAQPPHSTIALQPFEAVRLRSV